MFKVLRASKDTYITNKIVSGRRTTDANVGFAGTLDLYKLWDESVLSGSTEPIEISRVLIKFDLDPLRALTGSFLDPSHSSFTCKLKLYDVIGGQPLPSNYTLEVMALSQSFDEGIGRDVGLFRDVDSANFITASLTPSVTLWNEEGADSRGLLGSSDIDVISSGNLGNGVEDLSFQQTFTVGDEDLSIDVTKLVSATLYEQIPDYGFRISFIEAEETDERTRFVKRFGSRHSNNSRLWPRIDVTFDDSLIDWRPTFVFDHTGSIFLTNTLRDGRKNIVSGAGASEITGLNSLLVTLSTGSYSAVFTGSQHAHGTNFVTGVYSASFALSSFEPALRSHIIASGGITFTEVWGSLDGTVGFYTGSLDVDFQSPSSVVSNTRHVNARVLNLRDEYQSGNVVRLRVFLAEPQDHTITYTRIPIERRSTFVSDVHYQVRDAYDDEVVIAFDTTRHSTRLSADQDGYYFDLYTDGLDAGRAYTIEFLIEDQGNTSVIDSGRQIFRIT